MTMDDDSVPYAEFGALGGKRRAENLSAEERREIARTAALTRWQRSSDGSPSVIHKAIALGILKLGNIPCAVLDDAENTRVLTQSGLLTAIGRFPNPKSASNSDLAELPAFLRARNLKPFISSNLIRSSTPIIFETERRGGAGGSHALGYRAQILPQVCWVYAEAQMARKLFPGQRHIAEACKVLLKGLTNVAIDALVDEATGFQGIRAKNALIKLLEKYVSKEAFPWIKTFDDEFYKEMFRIHGYAYDPSSVKRPMIFAKRTEDIYNRLAPGVRAELQNVVKRGRSGRPSEKLFQHLTPEARQHLEAHLAGVKVIIRASTSTREYERLLDRVYPRFGDTLPLPFDDIGK
jgi:hypothetical protein